MKWTIFLFLCFGFNMMNGQENTDGEILFRNNCKACHSIDQKLVGPALKDIHLRRDSTWIYSFIKGSQKMIADGDSVGMALFQEFNQIPMPNQNLNDLEIGSILTYIKKESEPKLASENPIRRPLVDWGPAPTTLAFDNFMFWIPFTITVILLIYMLYYMTVISDFAKSDQE